MVNLSDVEQPVLYKSLWAFFFFCQWEELKYAVNAAKMSSVRSVYLALGKAASVSSTQVLYDLTLKERLQRLQTAV